MGRADCALQSLPVSPKLEEVVRPEVDAQERFLAGVQESGMPVTLRREKGHDIDAACGQLRLKTERELATAGPD